MKVEVATAMMIGTAVVFFTLGTAIARNGVSMHQKTMDNLSTAMHGEAFAYAKYMLYAEHARQSGNNELANLFESAAKTERFEHLAEEAELVDLVGTDANNLKDAISGESYEVETMYRTFADEAVAAGDKSAGERFEEIRKDEMKHRDAFKAALLGVEKASTGGK